VLFPLAPPRMLDGFVDTIHRSGQASIAHPAGLTNLYAAMPSFHVGWIVLTGVAAAPLAPKSLRWMLLLPGALMFAAVVATGNHYIVDGMCGIALALTALRVAQVVDPWRGALRSTVR